MNNEIMEELILNLKQLVSNYETYCEDGEELTDMAEMEVWADVQLARELLQRIKRY
jgi:hypothetical protein